MNILLTNDDGFDAPGLHAAYQAVRDFGTVHVIAPKTERSACSHTITLNKPITVERRSHHPTYGIGFAVDGTPADCVRLANAALVEKPIDLVVSGINRGANAGVDLFYSGTVAGAREGSILGINAIAVSQAVRAGSEVDWTLAEQVTRYLVESLLNEEMPGPGFWSINLPAPVPEDYKDHIQRVPLAVHPMPMNFDRAESDDGRVLEFGYGASYWLRDVTGPSDYSVIRDGGIAVTAVPLFGRF
jgi:5'-nucleotidase